MSKKQNTKDLDLRYNHEKEERDMKVQCGGVYGVFSAGDLQILFGRWDGRWMMVGGARQGYNDAKVSELIQLEIPN